jgi:hypothetical protein
MQWAYGLWGYLGEAPDDLVQWRQRLFRGAAEHYWDQRVIVDAVKTEALKLTPAQAASVGPGWKEYLIV